MADDPFDDIDSDAHRDREGDPFADLDAESDADGTPSVPETDSEGGGEGSGADSADPFEYMSEASGASDPERRAGDQADGPQDGPDGQRAESVDVAGDAFGDVDVSRGDPFEESGSAFERVDVDSVDPDAVWDRFTEGAEQTADPGHETLGGEAVPDDASDTVEVPKRRFCQTCPHFTAPPEIECTHEGTEILTFVGSDEVRVANCPVVDERRALGETFE